MAGFTPQAGESISKLSRVLAAKRRTQLAAPAIEAKRFLRLVLLAILEGESK